MTDPTNVPPPPLPALARRLLITAGPTHEPIDSVRFIANRSSGRLGVALADAAANRPDRAGSPWEVTLLLGPTPLTPSDPHVRLRRFLTTADLQALLDEEAPLCDVLVMAAAVADFRPRRIPHDHHGKIARSHGPLTIELEPTSDLLAAVAARRRPNQFIVGFALEPRERLLESAAAKLARKRLNLIVANPLETMDSPLIAATILDANGVVLDTHQPVAKETFARTLLDIVEQRTPVRPTPR